MTLNESYASLHYFLRKGFFYEALQIAEKAAHQFDDSTAKFWQAYCFLKLGKRPSAQELASLNPDSETRAMWARLKTFLGSPEPSGLMVSATDYAKANLALLAIYERDIKLARELTRKLPLSHHLSEIARASLDLYQY